jgi:hypothetical protein
VIGIEQTEALAADLAAAGERLEAAVKPVVAKGALNIKNAWRASASGLAHAPAYPYSITYDLDATAGSGYVAAEIGPDKDKKQGPLGNLIEFGSSKNPPHLDGARALAAEDPRLVAALEAAVEAATLT